MIKILGIIASQLTERLYRHCPLDPSKKAIYEYGIQLSLSTLASMCSIILLGILFGNPASAFLFLGVFFFLRLFSGGYHAPTYTRCFLLTNVVYLVVYALSQEIIHFRFFFLLPMIVVASCVTIIVLAPIRNRNHPLSEMTYAKNRKNAMVLSLLESLTLVFLFLWEGFRPYITVPVLSLAAVAVMMLFTLRRKEEYGK